MDYRVTDEDMIFDRINYLLEGFYLPFDIRGIDDLQKFLKDDGNRSIGVYSEIEELYKRLMGEENEK